MKEKLSKKQLKHLRKLADKAYETEISKRLEVLHEQFKKWKSEKISVWELSDLIHQFHDGDSRELYRFYVYGKNYSYQVACAIHNGHLSMEDVEESCRSHVQYLIDGFLHEEDN
jgi:hypothetical protein